MFFSILVPVYNTSKYLKKCIGSILEQTVTDYEIVLLEDGSTDESSRICDEYAARYPDIIRVIHKENEGLLLTRRRGFREAKGDWFICVDSDDYIAPNLLETVVNIRREYDCDMVMFNFSYVDDDGVTSKSRQDIRDLTVFSGESKRDIYEKRLLTNDYNTMARAIRREIVDIEADYSGCGIRNMSEDAVQILPIYTNAKKIVYCAEPLYYYRKGQTSITSSYSFSHWEAFKNCFSITEKYLDTWNMSPEIRAMFYTREAESIVDFLRWLFLVNADRAEDQLLSLLREDRFFKVRANYQKRYLQTTYLKYSVPIILHLVAKKQIRSLTLYFSIEKKLLKILKG